MEIIKIASNSFILLCSISLHLCNASFSQELEPRSLTNLPVGVNAFAGGYVYSSGNILLDPAVPIEDLKSKLHTFVFAYVGFTHFHPPWGVHPDFKNKSKAGIYADTKMEVDYNTGQIMDAIKKAGIEKNTIVILTGDNGAANYPSPGIVTGEVGGSNGPWRGGLSTAYEGGMRTPAMIRWPDNIPAGNVSDEIFADLDMYPSIANLIGENDRIPTDRPIDGMDQSQFLLGKQEKSNREYVVAYVGDKVFAVKWRNMKIHFAATEGTHSVVQTYTFPQVFDIKEDVKESFELWGNEGYIHAWVMEPVMKILAEKVISMKKYPNIKPGQDFSGYE